MLSLRSLAFGAVLAVKSMSSGLRSKVIVEVIV